MSIQLNGTLLKALIKRAGGVEAFLEIWMSFDKNGNDSVDQATVYRWCQGQLPKNERLFLRLAASLDVDPFAIVSIPGNDVAKTISDMLDYVQHRRSMPAPLKLARVFFGRQEEWPPEAVARDHFKRPWQVHEFSHDPNTRSNYYETVELLGTDPAVGARPQVFHFAYRNPQRFAGRWLHYGFVIRDEQGAKLWHINGHSQQIAIADRCDPLRIETFCGPEPIEFRVASLHAFSLATAQGRETGAPVLRFPA